MARAAEARTIKSAEAARRRLRQFKNKFKMAMDDFTVREARDVLREIKTGGWVPVDKDDLRKSGKVERVQVNQFTRKTVISFNTPYAWEQHENLEYNHTVGGPKYVERPMLMAMSGMTGRLAKDVRRRVR